MAEEAGGGVRKNITRARWNSESLEDTKGTWTVFSLDEDGMEVSTTLPPGFIVETEGNEFVIRKETEGECYSPVYTAENLEGLMDYLKQPRNE